MIKKAWLILEDGTSYEGKLFGADIESDGEVVFNTGMVGYPESLTDPSYRGQIIVFTYPLIGNYGIPAETERPLKIREFFESVEIQCRGIIVSEYSNNYSHWNAEKSLSEWLKKYNIPAITGIDTRALTQKLREKGTMLGTIQTRLKKNTQKTKIQNPNLINLIDEVSVKEPITFSAGEKHVVIIDFGYKNNIIRSFLKRNISVTIIPWDYDPFSANLKMDGLFLTNGPGDPISVRSSCAVVQKAMNKKMPVWGICMGNQIMALAVGGKTYKMKYGHRSQNQPCIDLETGRCYITSQNHGFAVEAESLPKNFEVWFENANDHTVEGIKHKNLPFKAVQFHPEASPGPTDTEFIFDEFVKTL